jgi:hypothetical protein
MASAIPGYLIDFFLRGQTRRAAFEQFMKDGGVTIDVWLAFGSDSNRPVRVLIAPVDGYTPAELGYALHRSLLHYRAEKKLSDRGSPGISPMEDYLVARIYLDELLYVLLPLTDFFYRNRFDQLAGDPAKGTQSRTEQLEREIRRRLGEAGLNRDAPSEAPLPAARRKRASAAQVRAARIDHERRRGIIAAAPVAALVGLIEAWERLPKQLGDTPVPSEGLNRLSPDTRAICNRWVAANAPEIAQSAVAALTRQTTLREKDMISPAGSGVRQPTDAEGRRQPMIQRVFIDRDARLSHKEAICAVKGDAAQLLFEITCKDITWAIIDSGIAATHPAFIDHAAQRSRPTDPPVSRVRKTFDFSMISRIRNFDLIEADAKAIDHLVQELAALPVARKDPDAFPGRAGEALRNIASQLKLGLRPDWRLIEPLIEIEPDDGRELSSDHGTHVAGTLGGDWREADGERRLAGICPDISLYDMRVIPYPGLGAADPDEQIFATESAVLAALEFIQHLNSRTMVRTQIIHGVNVSMSIPHDVRNYGAGATPICVACDRLVGSGVVVVAAAGNRGWNEQEIGFGNFVFCSITDPGNARDVITVGSTHPSKPHIYGVSYFSSRGPTGDGRIKPDIVAPGEGIRAPIRNEAEGELSGTSMAAPFVSGGAAMVMARHPEMIGKPMEVKATLCGSATDLQRERYFQGHGLLDVLRAIQSR